MKIRIISDIHLEFGDWEPPQVESDVVVLAGDISISCAGLYWARKHFPDTAIVYVAGNHEFYGRQMEQEFVALRHDAQSLGISFLEKDSITINGVRFLGATLWTDFKLHGDGQETQLRAKNAALDQINDFRHIGYKGRTFHPDDAQALHAQSMRWMRKTLAAPFDGKTVAVTHYLPHARCIDTRYSGSEINAAFASHLSIVRQPVDLWIHGHTHHSVNFVTHGTRVVCNPRGYTPHELNKTFDPGLVFDLNAGKLQREKTRNGLQDHFTSGERTSPK